MRTPEIKDTIRANNNLIMRVNVEYIELYLFSLLFIPDSQMYRMKILKFARGILLSKRNENDILRFLEGARLSEEDNVSFLNELDYISDQIWEVYDHGMAGFEEALKFKYYNHLPDSFPEKYILRDDIKQDFYERIQRKTEEHHL